jgi:hypothetical protein
MTRILDTVTALSTFTIVLLATAAVLLLWLLWTMRRRRVDLYRDDLPPLVFAVHERVRAPADMRPASFGNREARQHAERAPEPVAPPDFGREQRSGAVESTMRVPRYSGPVSMAFLPGHLVVQAAGQTGPRPGEEIRFPARRQGDGVVILGRDDGPSGATVRVPAESVSRRHARLHFENGRWNITNLSRTNPTLLNGEELMVTGGARWLTDGDIIEMGEMVFRFHEQ